MSRYDHLYSYVEENKPEVVLETGTWNGLNAKKLLNLGVKKYIGFDVFDDVSEGLDEIENNVKKHFTEDEVLETLKGFDVELVKGNTRHTLKEYKKGEKPFVDMAFLDGGHSYATIKSDILNAFRLVKTNGVIFMDDYYFGCKERVGAQTVLGELNLPYTVLPKVDRAKGGYLIKMVRIDMKYVPRVDWDMPNEKSWKYEP